MTIQIACGNDFEQWREHARGLIQSGFAPDAVLWESEAAPGLFPLAPPPVTSAAEALPKVPAAFMKLAKSVACHAAPQRWALLYRLLWRQTHGGERTVLANPADADVATAQTMAKAVAREVHKMHAFVRFRQAATAPDGRERFVAWFEPEHWIIQAAAPFFANRFANMDWSIFTPKGCAHWDGQALAFSPGLERDPCDHADALETYWKTYYQSIFNPARIKIAMMRSEMPERYWKNLPEAELIPQLIRESRPRVGEMFATPERPARPLHGNAYLESLRPTAPEANLPEPRTLTLEEIATALPQCRRCPLWERATCAVPGQGPAGARVMIIGEAPGDHEDLHGRPFIGPAGQLLTQALGEAGVERSSAYLTNAVKHFKWTPRGKRRLHQRPGPQEIDACRPWVLAEVEKVAPETLILLGSTAAASLLGGGVQVTQERGVISHHPFGAKRMILTVHPSSILRQHGEAARNAAYQQFVADLALAATPAK